MPSPIIGVTLNRVINANGRSNMTVNEKYVSALAQAGAAPVMIPLGLSKNVLDDILSRLDGILFTGGGDVDPGCYGSQPHPMVGDVDPDRDRVEILLLQAIKATRKPFLGICRGIQLINVALGGTLYEDIADQRPNSIRHPCYPDLPRDHLAHTVQLEANSRLFQIIGQSTVQVNSLHHQGLRRLADGLRATAHAPDDLVEGIELLEYPFGVAVQWHPEELQAHASMRALFRAFVEAAVH